MCARQLALLTLQPQPAAPPLRVLLQSLSGVRPALALGQQAVLRTCGPWGHAPSGIGAARGRQGTRFGAQHTCGCVCACSRWHRCGATLHLTGLHCFRRAGPPCPGPFAVPGDGSQGPGVEPDVCMDCRNSAPPEHIVAWLCVSSIQAGQIRSLQHHTSDLCSIITSSVCQLRPHHLTKPQRSQLDLPSAVGSHDTCMLCSSTPACRPQLSRWQRHKAGTWTPLPIKALVCRLRPMHLLRSLSS